MRHRLFAIITAIFLAVSAFAADAPRYIFYFIGDGMGMGQVMAAEAYNRLVLKADKPLLMMQFPVVSVATTYSASSPVTDSAASGTALATGVKTKNGMLGMDADTVAVTSIARQLADKGYGVAIITSVAPDDATPGAFFAHVPNRGMYYEVGCQLAEAGYDLIGGSHLRGLKDKKGNDTDLLDRIAANDVTIARGLEEMAAVPAGKKVLLLNPSEIDYHQIHFTIDSVKGAMTLPDMTRAAIDRMETNGRDRFFMMVEGGNIDYGGHANDGGTIIKEVINFNQALQHAYDFYLQHPDETLILVSADHETGGLGLGNNKVGYDLHPEVVDYQKISKDRFNEYVQSIAKSRRIYEWPDMKEFLTENLGLFGPLPVSEEQEADLKEKFEKCMQGRNEGGNKTLYADFNAFSEAVYRVQDSLTGLGFTSNGHTGGLVPVYAVGVGAELFAPQNDNALLPAKIREIAGVED